MLTPISDAFETELRARLAPRCFRDPAAGYLTEPRSAFQGRADLVVAPETTADISWIVKRAAQDRVGIIPYGGGTGLVGGQVSEDAPAPLILSLEHMTALRAVHPSENVLIAEAGTILANVHAAAARADRLFPLSLASEGSARIGGLLATNAGGVNVLRYGTARELCLGLEAVLPDGQIWYGLKRLRKDNTGYDLRDLLIGSEGTLGVITAAALRLFPQPATQSAALMVVPDPAAALRLLNMAQSLIGDGISAFELIAGMGLTFLTETLPHVRQPFPTPPDWMVLVDLGLEPGRDPSALLETLFAQGHDAGLVSDGLVAQSESQRQDFWQLRESIPEANRLVGAISSHDISLPLGAVAEFIRKGHKKLAKLGRYRINCFGHLGDGNLHFNVFPLPGERRADRLMEKPAVQEAVHDLVHKMDGSFSAEHGVGRLKTRDLQRYGDPAKLSAMRAIKRALDPHGIMNPGAVLGAS